MENKIEVNYTPILLKFNNIKGEEIGHLIVTDKGELDFKGEATESAKEFVRLAKYWLERKDEITGKFNEVSG